MWLFEVIEIQVTYFSSEKSNSWKMSKLWRWQERSCDKILVFQNYFKDCVFDLCELGGARPILCEAIEAYANECQDRGVTIGPWRNETFCRKLFLTTVWKQRKEVNGYSWKLTLWSTCSLGLRLQQPLRAVRRLVPRDMFRHAPLLRWSLFWRLCLRSRLCPAWWQVRVEHHLFRRRLPFQRPALWGTVKLCLHNHGRNVYLLVFYVLDPRCSNLLESVFVF